jgi:hypothetical protein
MSLKLALGYLWNNLGQRGCDLVIGLLGGNLICSRLSLSGFEVASLTS